MSTVRKYFGVTDVEYMQMYNDQEGKCPICKVTLDRHSANLDHDHIYNLVRNLLCNKCNLAIGLLQDSPSIARSLADYLEKWQDIHSKEVD